MPLVLVAFNRGSGQLFWVQRPNHKVDVQVLQSLTSAGLQPSFHRTATTTVLLIATVLALLAIIGWQLRSAWRSEGDWGFGVVLGWAVVPALLTFVYSLAAQPLFVPRNLLMSTPAVGLAAGRRARAPSGAASGRPRRARRAAGVARAAGRRRLWRLARAVAAGHGLRARPRARRATASPSIRWTAGWRFSTTSATRPPRPTPPRVRSCPSSDGGRSSPYVERYGTLSRAQIAARAAGCRRMWFVSSHEGQADGPAASLVNRARWLTLRCAPAVGVRASARSASSATRR